MHIDCTEDETHASPVHDCGPDDDCRVRSIDFHRLRAHVATLVEGLRICAREGWLGSARRNHRDPVRRGERRGVAIARSLAGMRQRMGLTAPYGPQAAALGFNAAPPSRRVRSAPPGDPPTA